LQDKLFQNPIPVGKPFGKINNAMKQASPILLAILAFTLQLSGIHCSDRSSNNSVAAPGQQTASAGTANRRSPGGADDFVAASRTAMPAVVHIKTQYNAPASGNGNPFEQIYGPPARGSVPAMGSGSGVTLTPDGYIATNNHVVENAAAIEVIFPDRRSFTARLVGTDPNTDLALLKVNAKNLPIVKPGNSDAVQVGEWVLAVGYPFSLNTTVTAGIISAKGRSIGIINRSRENSFNEPEAQGGNTAIESFLQTDAAINPGNSGGALVNTAGELIGINTAIASQTGSYAGYAFAIPINLATKVLDDLKKYGSVKRGVLGVSFPSPAVEDQYLRQQGIDPGSVKGVYIIDVLNGSAAAAAGLKEGDFIQSIDGATVASASEFSERIARHRPGDNVTLAYLRNGKTATATVTLKGEETTMAKQGQSLEDIYTKLGAVFAPLTSELRQRLSIRSGVMVTDVRSGGFFDRIGIPPGTIIVIINGKPVNSPNDIDQALLSAQSGLIQMLAIAPDGSRVAFNFSLGT
jgi:Do/DeqQ family serine protease